MKSETGFAPVTTGSGLVAPEDARLDALAAARRDAQAARDRVDGVVGFDGQFHLRRHADAAARHDIAVIHADGVGAEERPEHRLEERALARAVRADDADDADGGEDDLHLVQALEVLDAQFLEDHAAAPVSAGSGSSVGTDSGVGSSPRSASSSRVRPVSRKVAAKAGS